MSYKPIILLTFHYGSTLKILKIKCSDHNPCEFLSHSFFLEGYFLLISFCIWKHKILLLLSLRLGSAFCACPSGSVFSCESRALFTGLTSTIFSNFFFKIESHDTIYTFKNYFATVFSVFSNKWYPNKPLISLFVVLVEC